MRSAAKERYKIGDRVQTTRAYEECFKKQRRGGVVVGFSFDEYGVAVVFDGTKHRRRMEMQFLEKEPANGAQSESPGDGAGA